MKNLAIKVLNCLRKENIFGKYYSVSLKPLYKKTFSVRHFLTLTPGRILLSVFFILGIFQVAFNSGPKNVTVLILCLLIASAVYLKLKFFPRNRLYLPTLRAFVYQNKLFEEIDGKLISEINMGYIEDEEVLHVIVERHGDRYQNVSDKLGDALASKLGMRLYETVVDLTFVDYVFSKVEIARKSIKSLPKEDNNLLIPIYGELEINLRKNYSLLLSGSSGSGKSFLTYFYLTRFISQTLEGKHAKIWGIDPKRSDLYKLFKVSGMPSSSYGADIADAFRIVKSYLQELERRMNLYDESPAFDSVGIDIGLEPCLLVIEEYSSLVSAMDSKQKKEFESMITIIAQKARSLSMGLLIVMQQPRSDSLSTSIREQLQNAVFMGNPTKEAANMMFGTGEVPKVNGTGVGMYSIERGTPQRFESPVFEGDVFDIILPVWKHVAESYEKEISPNSI